MKVITHTLTSTTPTSAMTPSGLISAVTFLIIIPTALIIRLLTLLNLNAVVLYYPPVLSSHESRLPASFDNDSTLEFDVKDQTTDFLPLWLSHMFQNHNLSKSMPGWKGQNAPVAVSVYLTVDFAQPPVNHSLDQMVAINLTRPITQNGISHSILPSNTTAHLHNETLHPSGFRDHEGHESRTEEPFQFAGVANLLRYTAGLALAYFAAWRQAFHMRSSYRSFLRMARKSRVTAPSRGHDGHVKDQDTRVPPYESIVSEGTYSKTPHSPPS